MTAAHPSPAMQPVLRLSGISKSFPGVRALSEVALDLFPGQVTALIGENGAGKSTIVKILTGIYQPDAGRIEVNGQDTRFPTAVAAARAGVTAIHQETVLFDDLSVAENIFLGHAPRTRLGLIDWPVMEARARDLLARIGADLNPRSVLRDMGIASKHLVAIARALSIDAQVVIMDEPTAALSHKEIHELYDLVERLKAEGKAILFISHKFDEIFRIADRYTVFRDGAFIGAGRMRDVTEGQLVQMMVGRSVDQIFPKRAHNIGAPVLTVSGYSHPTEFADISFTLHRGEILGFYGLVGAGRSEVMQSLFGLTTPSKGACRIEDRVVVLRSTAQAIEEGIVYVPEDRGKQGAVKGVQVGVVVDGFGSMATLPRLQDWLGADGVHLDVFRPLDRWWRLLHPGQLGKALDEAIEEFANYHYQAGLNGTGSPPDQRQLRRACARFGRVMGLSDGALSAGNARDGLPFSRMRLHP